jgi:hypothetical protein
MFLVPVQKAMLFKGPLLFFNLYSNCHLVCSCSSTIISEDCYDGLSVSGYHNNVFFFCVRVQLFAIPCEMLEQSASHKAGVEKK